MRTSIRLKNTESAIKLFRESAIIHEESTQEGNYKIGNKAHDKIIEALRYLFINNKMNELLPLLDDSSNGVKVWAATYLLPMYEDKAINTLKTINSFTANIVLDEWNKGCLILSLVYGYSESE
jgi:hypothetical protein